MTLNLLHTKTQTYASFDHHSLNTKTD